MIKTKKWTYEDYYQLNDGKRYELIEGELIVMAPAPNFSHQKISIKLASKLLAYVEKRKLGEVLDAPIDVQLNKYNTLQPDIIFISKERYSIIEERAIFGSPDLVIEILSPSTEKADRKTKYQLYEQFKVKEYWIVDPKKQTIEVYTLESDKYKLFCSGDKVKSKLLTDFEIEFKELVE